VVKTYDSFYIGGHWVKAQGNATADVFNSATEEIIGTVPMGTAADVDAAVAAAKAAFEDWAATPTEIRTKYVREIGAALGARTDEIAELLSQEVGMPVTSAKFIQAGLAVSDWNNYAEAMESYPLEEQVGNALVVKEPIGVVGCITPWNYPLYLIVCKVAPALAAGCTVVLKPSEVTPLNAYLLTEVIDSVGLPAGVFNMVIGAGPEVGAAIAAHPDVDMVSFTGSGAAGKAVQKAAADNVKRVHLELGGKSANIVLDDADIDSIAAGAVFGCFLNSGQTCSALTRLLVPASRHDEIVDRIAQEVAACRLVDPSLEDFDFFHAFGPLVSKVQQERVREYIRKGEAEGATLVVGGADQPDDKPSGYYVKPTLFANVTPDMTIAQEEIFGPVLSVIPYADEDDAIRIANGPIYGLAGAVQSADPERAKAVARRMRTGQVDINGAAFNPVAPFGGYKQSGAGRERGRYALDEYFETKAIGLPA
jgi:acyl-CoA reductase-like NAD-dependent aldehyde dehydrogenase